jgi:hypothetical protein
MEFPHLMRLIEDIQFDTIYHEHFSYFSLWTIDRIFSFHGLTVFDVEQLTTHGGSLRIYAKHDDDASKPILDRVCSLKELETQKGYTDLDLFFRFAEKVRASRRKILNFLIRAKEDNKKIIAYGAPAKGNTLLNYCGVKSNLIEFTVDRNPYKQGRYLPGSHIYIDHPDKIKEAKPDYLFVLPWNLQTEIMEQMAFIRDWGGRFVLPIPSLKII